MRVTRFRDVRWADRSATTRLRGYDSHCIAASLPENGAIMLVTGERNPGMIAKLLLQNTFFVLAFGAVLFGSAGTLDWPAAWVFLLVSATLGPACGLWLARTDPALLAERLRPTFQADQPAADKKFMIAFAVASLVWLIAIGLDRRAHASMFRSRCRRSGLRCICSRPPSSCGCSARIRLPRLS